MRFGPQTPPCVMCPENVLVLFFRSAEELEEFKAKARTSDGATLRDQETDDADPDD